MSKRTQILKALTEKLKLIDGYPPYNTNLKGNAFAKLKFWDEVNDFPSVYMHPGTETRDYHPSHFAWAMLNICIKIYCKSEDTAQEDLEVLLQDVETCIDLNRRLVYDDTNGYETTEILIDSITTDEGLLAPYAVGEINLQVRYQVMYLPA
jgi:hypothetical protein